jgi:trans-aconitate 2-methyltransferase
MSDYWDRRFRAEGRIWGLAASTTAARAEGEFRKAGARRILIPGAGYGRNAEFFSGSGYEVTGVEISPEALRLAKEGSSVRYVQGSVLDLEAPREGYDGVYCHNVLHLFLRKERRKCIEKCHGALKPGGMAFFAVFSDAEPQYGKGREAEENTFESKPGRPVHFYTDADMRADFAGFEIVETGTMEDLENHGSEGPHVHVLRYICARKRAFDFDGGKYAKASRHQKEWGHKIISELELKGSERVLDLGCGDGALTAEIGRFVPQGSVTGIDTSASMIETAGKAAGGNVSFRLMDIDAMDFDRRFDLIFSNATLHWVKDHRRLLANCRRALAENGRLRFNFAGHGNCPRFISVVQDEMGRERFRGYFTGFAWPWFMPRADEYEKLAGECGPFAVMKVWEENADRGFTRDELIRWIDQPSIVPFLAPIAGEDREPFRLAVREKMLETTRTADGRFFETFRRINVSARVSPP